MKTNEFPGIIATIDMYFKGTFYGDGNMLRKAFHADARITGLINDELFDWSLEDFIARVVADPTAEKRGETFNKKIVTIDHANKAVMVKARVTIGQLIFTDYITLLKIDGRWIIRNKSFTT